VGRVSSAFESAMSLLEVKSPSRFKWLRANAGASDYTVMTVANNAIPTMMNSIECYFEKIDEQFEPQFILPGTY
jgi:hypothetical protein